MGSWRDSWMHYRDKIRDKKIKSIEKRTGVKATSEQRKEAIKEANVTLLKRIGKRIGKRIAIFLGAVGITVGGYAALNAGDNEKTTEGDPKVEEQDNGTGGKINARNGFVEDLVNQAKETIEQNTYQKEENTVDKIAEVYTENVAGEKVDIGVIKQSGGSVGQIIQDASGNYIKSPKSVDQLEEGQVHVDEQIKDGYFLVNNENHETIAGVIETAEGYHEITVDYASIKDTDGSEIVYTKNPDTYVHLEELFNDQLENGEISWNTIGESLEKYYEERVNDLSNEDEGR